MAKDFTKAYKTMTSESFPAKMEVSFYNDDNDRQTLFYEKAAWDIGGEKKGLRYGENPDQPAALYKLVNGNLSFGDVTCIQPGNYLASDIELLQSGKHPGKINVTDADSALNILRYFSGEPCTVIVKHNNPCGVAKAATLSESYYKALMADRIAAFGGAVAFNKPVDIATAELVVKNYLEVVIAPDFEEGVLELFAKKKNLRVMKIENMNRLQSFVGQQVVEYKSLIDGGIIVQTGFTPKALTKDDFTIAESVYKEKEYKVNRMPTDQEFDDMIFGWLVEAGVTSNSVIYVKNGVTVGIGTGEQDRVGVAEIARDKAYRKLADSICFEKYQTPLALLDDQEKRGEIEKEVAALNGGIKGSVMVSDAFFPFKDGVEVGLKEGVSAVVQPGGSIRDFESIEACNEHGATMVYTGQRSFRH